MNLMMHPMTHYKQFDASCIRDLLKISLETSSSRITRAQAKDNVKTTKNEERSSARVIDGVPKPPLYIVCHTDMAFSEH